eukprot:10832186-Ditylum_brightwellii.AAC.1
MLVELSESQDVVAGDGTTSVVVLCGSLLGKALSLLQRGIHPTLVSDSLHKVATPAVLCVHANTNANGRRHLAHPGCDQGSRDLDGDGNTCHAGRSRRASEVSKHLSE